MTPIDVLLIADDLTGACDAAVHFAIHGIHPATVVLAGAPSPEVRVLAISTESRDIPPPQIRQALAKAAAAFPSTRIFKKIDSTLRGNAGLEIAAALDSFHCDAAVVCPAFPTMHRIVHEGYLTVSNAPDFAPIDLAGLLERQSGQPCAHTRPDNLLAHLSAGVRTIAVDATCEDDLDCIAAALLPMGRRILWAGSAGLAAALARRLGTSCAAPGSPQSSPGPALFCIGSDHAVTLAQQTALLTERAAVLLHPDIATRDTVHGALGAGQHVVLRLPRGRVPVEQVRECIAGAPAAALVLSGGDTASLVCRAAGATRIELSHEIVPGVPRGTLRGGILDGAPVATKSGGFGNRDTLIQVADYFHARSEH